MAAISPNGNALTSFLRGGRGGTLARSSTRSCQSRQSQSVRQCFRGGENSYILVNGSAIVHAETTRPDLFFLTMGAVALASIIAVSDGLFLCSNEVFGASFAAVLRVSVALSVLLLVWTSVILFNVTPPKERCRIGRYIWKCCGLRLANSGHGRGIRHLVSRRGGCQNGWPCSREAFQAAEYDG